MARVPVNDKMLQTAQELIKYSRSIDHRAKLRRIINGEVKHIGSEWWRQVNDAANKRKLEKIRPMADPARNPNEHQRRVALAKQEAILAAPTPGLEEYDRQQAQRFAADIAKFEGLGLFDDFVRANDEAVEAASASASTPTPPPSSEKAPAATTGAPPTTPRSPRFREARPEEYGKSYVIGAALPPKQDR
jgi:hypothetical protein